MNTKITELGELDHPVVPSAAIGPKVLGNSRMNNLITIGCGPKFDRAKFTAAGNASVFGKPSGGLWASPVDSDYGWPEFLAETFSPAIVRQQNETSFRFAIEGEILRVTSRADLDLLPWVEDPYISGLEYIDYEELGASGEVDAVWLTMEGRLRVGSALPLTQKEFRTHTGGMCFLRHLACWDCETVFVINPDCVFPEL